MKQAAIGMKKDERERYGEEVLRTVCASHEDTEICRNTKLASTHLGCNYNF